MDIFNGFSSFPSRIYSHKTNRNIKRIGIKHKKRNEPFEIRRRKQWGFIKPFLSVVTGRAVRLGFVCQNWTLGIIRFFSASLSEMRVSNTGRRAVYDMNGLSAAACCRHLLTKHCTTNCVRFYLLTLGHPQHHLPHLYPHLSSSPYHWTNGPTLFSLNHVIALDFPINPNTTTTKQRSPNR